MHLLRSFYVNRGRCIIPNRSLNRYIVSSMLSYSWLSKTAPLQMVYALPKRKSDYQCCSFSDMLPSDSLFSDDESAGSAPPDVVLSACK